VNFHPVHCLQSFHLVALMGRCKYSLSEQSIGFIVQATLCGVAANFKPTQLSGRVFKFVVASHNVGFHTFHLKSYTCDQYKIFFHLWGNAGPH
jgi:hypothetical protein